MARIKKVSAESRESIGGEIAEDSAESRPAKKAKRSALEVRWAKEWARQGGPALVEELRFHPGRMWRADFAHVESRTLIEIEGGAWTGGRHTRGKGFEEDAEKYLAAHLAGWRVVRICGAQVRGDVIRAVIAEIEGRMPSDDGVPDGFEAGGMVENEATTRPEWLNPRAR
jgi:hypothetical protein